jgi:hypothetical protein
MYKHKMNLICLLAAVFFFAPAIASATSNISLRVEGPDRTFVDVGLSLPDSCDVADGSTTTLRTFSGDKAICALEQAKQVGLLDAYQVTDWGFGYSLDSINDAANTPDWSQLWTIRVNNVTAPIGIDGVSLAPGDELLLAYGPWPLEPLETRLSSSTAILGESSVIDAYAWNDTGNLFEKFIATTTFRLGGEFFEAATGTLSWTPAATGTIEVYAEAPGKARSRRLSLAVIEAVASSTPDAQATGTPPVHDPENNNAPGGGGTVITHQTIDIAKAVNFLISNQLPDGSIGGDRVVSDWAALAFRAAGAGASAKDALKNYLLADNPGMKTTDYERRAMALMALDVDPYTAGTDYIGKITSAFDGRQIGDAAYFNDDIFGLLSLYAAGYSNADEIVVKTVGFTLSNQQANGSWGGVDLTAAAVQILVQAKNQAGLTQDLESRISEALLKAKTYLKGSQSNTGQIGDNSMSTSWAIQAINALGESPMDWENNHHNPDDFLASKQSADGGLEEATLPNNIRFWSTAYAITAATGKTWSALLMNFSRPASPSNGASVSASSSADVLIIATTTGSMATTTTDETATTTVSSVETEAATSTALIEALTEPITAVGSVQPAVKGVKLAYARAPQLGGAGQEQAPDQAQDKKVSIPAPAEVKSTSVPVDETPSRLSKYYFKYIFFLSGAVALALGIYLISSRRGKTS